MKKKRKSNCCTDSTLYANCNDVQKHPACQLQEHVMSTLGIYVTIQKRPCLVQEINQQWVNSTTIHTASENRYRAVQSVLYGVLAPPYICMTFNKTTLWLSLIYWFVEITFSCFLWGCIRTVFDIIQCLFYNMCCIQFHYFCSYLLFRMCQPLDISLFLKELNYLETFFQIICDAL